MLIMTLMIIKIIVNKLIVNIEWLKEKKGLFSNGKSKKNDGHRTLVFVYCLLMIIKMR